jgi:hypothetical protein
MELVNDEESLIQFLSWRPKCERVCLVLKEDGVVGKGNDNAKSTKECY